MPGNHALVFGASGVNGWAITNALLSNYPSADAFSRITALTNRSLSNDLALWPQNDKFQVVSGIDLLSAGGAEGVKKEMQSRIKDVETISHVFFFAYIFNGDPNKEIEINVKLLQHAITAVEQISSNLKFVVLPTGTKAYGVHLVDEFPFSSQLPLKESLPRIPEPYASQMFYYNQIDMLTSLSAGKPWTWCDIRPDIVVGFVPNNNVYCMAQALALYLSCAAAVEGKGAEIQFPGTEKSWVNLSCDSSQDIVAKFCIHASLNPDKAGGEAFNVADNAKPTTWSAKWPVICEYFGLKGVPPPAGGSGPLPYDYLADHLAEWKELEKKHGLHTGRVGNDRSLGGYPQFIMSIFNFDRHMDMSKTHAVWGDRTIETDTKGGWWTAFDRFRKAKIIP